MVTTGISSADMADELAEAGNGMPVTSRHTLVRRAIREIWNAGDIALSDELFAADYVNHGGLIPDLVRGPEAIKISVERHDTYSLYGRQDRRNLDELGPRGHGHDA